MKRWNGWGDDAVTYPLPDGAKAFLDERVGPGTPPSDAKLGDVVASVPPSRLPDHSLVGTDPTERVRFARGQSFPDWVAVRTGRVPIFPDGVARPRSSDDVRELLRYAYEVGARVIPYGGGTSVVGHINPEPGDPPVLTVSMDRMDDLVRLDEQSRLATFGAGIAGPEIEARLKSRGYVLGHYPQSYEFSTLGGWVATRSSGQQSAGFGRIERLFAGGVVQTPNGDLVLPPHPASAAGPDLRELVMGSEGRMGIITEATVRVTPEPEADTFRAVFLPDWLRGREAAREIAQSGIPFSMLRMSTPIETETLLALAGHKRLTNALEWVLSLRGAAKDKTMLLMAFTGSHASVTAARRQAFQIARGHGGVQVGRLIGKQWAKSRFRAPYLRNTLWEAGYAIDTLETATTWAKVPDTLEAIENALRPGLEDIGERVYVFTHLSHVYTSGSSIYTSYIFRLAPDPDENLRRWEKLKRAASEAIVAHGGTISHQHGVGVDHRPYLEAEKGASGLKALDAAMRSWDPKGLMNPGKLLP